MERREVFASESVANVCHSTSCHRIEQVPSPNAAHEMFSERYGCSILPARALSRISNKLVDKAQLPRKSAELRWCLLGKYFPEQFILAESLAAPEISSDPFQRRATFQRSRLGRSVRRRGNTGAAAAECRAKSGRRAWRDESDNAERSCSGNGAAEYQPRSREIEATRGQRRITTRSTSIGRLPFLPVASAEIQIFPPLASKRSSDPALTPD